MRCPAPARARRAPGSRRRPPPRGRSPPAPVVFSGRTIATTAAPMLGLRIAIAPCSAELPALDRRLFPIVLATRRLLSGAACAPLHPRAAGVLEGITKRRQRLPGIGY